MEKTKQKEALRALCETAVMVALAVALSFVKVDLWAQGGSLNLVMIPIIIVGYRRGWQWSIPAGLAFGLIKCAMGEGFSYGFASVMLDYVLAYGAVGLAGFFKGAKHGMAIGSVVGSAARFLVHFASGVTIYRIGIGESVELFGKTYGSDAAVLYSIVYNGSYMLVNMIVAVVVSLLIEKAISRIPK